MANPDRTVTITVEFGVVDLDAALAKIAELKQAITSTPTIVGDAATLAATLANTIKNTIKRGQIPPEPRQGRTLFQ